MTRKSTFSTMATTGQRRSGVKSDEHPYPWVEDDVESLVEWVQISASNTPRWILTNGSTMKKQYRNTGTQSLNEIDEKKTQIEYGIMVDLRSAALQGNHVKRHVDMV